MTSTSRLRAVPQLVGKTGFDYRFDVASQVLAAGTRMCLSKPSPRCLVQAGGRLVCWSAASWSTSPTGKPCGRSWTPGEAEVLADDVFGPDLSPPRAGGQPPKGA